MHTHAYLIVSNAQSAFWLRVMEKTNRKKKRNAPDENSKGSVDNLDEVVMLLHLNPLRNTYSL
jgi:hypothetical protein